MKCDRKLMPLQPAELRNGEVNEMQSSFNGRLWNDNATSTLVGSNIPLEFKVKLIMYYLACTLTAIFNW